MGKVFWSAGTLIVIFVLNWAAVHLIGGSFIDYSFFIGLMVAVVIWFTNSSGGIVSSSIRMNVQAQTGIKIEEEKKNFNPTVTFVTAVIYTLISAIATFIYYIDYFIN
ncbi:hypothetical protein [Oceanobacillus massiliensis]|uniref:hypothetical protein n=1 Tax=Oceanobacillus massiliensis TaxID=1465765 RepID=UPI000288C8E7|nr:hypothetical protein [Oceanobacillus massiliensis]